MIEIKISNEENIDKVLKRFKKKIDKVRTLKLIRYYSHHQKPSMRKKDERLKSLYKKRMILEENR